MPRLNKAIPQWNGETWIYRPYVDGIQKKYTSNIPGKLGLAECRRKLSLAVEKNDNASMRLSQAWEGFLEDLINELGVDSETYKKNESIGRIHILPRLKNMKVSRITDQDWQECISKADCTRGGHDRLSKKTLKHIRAAITRFNKFARKRRLVDSPLIDLYVPKTAPTYERQIIQPDALKSFLADPGQEQWYMNAWKLMVVTGLRPGECYGLKREDVSGNKICIMRSIRKDGQITAGKNDNALRGMVKTNIAQKYVDAQLALMKENDIISPWLFCDEYGRQPKPGIIGHRWEDYRESLPYHVTLYGLRHTFVSLTEKKLPKSLLKSLVGHSESMDTYSYVHAVTGDDMAAAKIVDEIFDEIIK